MKNRRILVSVAMLLLSAVLLSSASFAWFSMNTTVEVDGIEFEAYSDSLFLEISEDNSDFTPDDLTINNDKKTLRPVAYGTIEALGTIYTLVATEITSDLEYYTSAGINYYTKSLKADGNDTKVGSEFDYICANEDLYFGSSVEGLYILGSGVVLAPVTDATYDGDVFAKEGNDYVKVDNPTSKLGYYYISNTPTACGNVTYVPQNLYYQATTGADGSIVELTLVNGLNAGSRLKGYYTLALTEVSEPVAGQNYYFKNSDNDLVAFTAHTEDGVGLDGYWYRGYSENIVPGTPDADAQNISGVIGGMNAQNSDYVLYDTIYLRMAEGSANATNLRISHVDVQGSDYQYALTKAVRIIFVCSSSAHGQTARILYNNATGTFTNLDTDATSALIDANLIGNTGEVITVDMYVYYDGTHASVATHDALNLSGHAIKVGFEIDKPAYAN